MFHRWSSQDKEWIWKKMFSFFASWLALCCTAYVSVNMIMVLCWPWTVVETWSLIKAWKLLQPHKSRHEQLLWLCQAVAWRTPQEQSLDLAVATWTLQFCLSRRKYVQPESLWDHVFANYNIVYDIHIVWVYSYKYNLFIRYCRYLCKHVWYPALLSCSVIIANLARISLEVPTWNHAINSVWQNVNFCTNKFHHSPKETAKYRPFGILSR